MMLTIAIVNWNTVDLLRDCLTSVFENCDEAETEVIVVDNASVDNSVPMVKQLFPQVILIENSANKGFAAANNQIFRIANGKHVLLLNSDTIIHGKVLQNSVDYLERNIDVGAMGCRVLNTDGTVQLTCSEFPTLTNQFIMASGLWKLKYPRWFGKYMMTHWQRDSERPVEVISGCYLLVRNKVLEEVGLLDEDFFFFGEETDWCTRMRQAGWELMFSPVGEITHHGGGSVKKLNHRRDVMLTSAKVKLHKKHGGALPAFICWLIAALFNGSRAVFWTLRAMVDRSKVVRNRATHFQNVFWGLGQTWNGKL